MEKTKSIILAGVGGQGTILVSKILTSGLILAGHDVKMSEIHGMAQRGGSVSTQVRYGNKVHSPIIGQGEADILIAFEKMEALRYCQYLKPDGVILVNDYKIVPMTVAAGLAEYPEGIIPELKKYYKTIAINAGQAAMDLGNAKCMNVVLFGAMVELLKMDNIDWKTILRETLPAKLVDLNLNAFEKGKQLAGE